MAGLDGERHRDGEQHDHGCNGRQQAIARPEGAWNRHHGSRRAEGISRDPFYQQVRFDARAARWIIQRGGDQREVAGARCCILWGMYGQHCLGDRSGGNGQADRRERVPAFREPRDVQQIAPRLNARVMHRHDGPGQPAPLHLEMPR